MSETAEAGKDGANLSLLSKLKKLQLSGNGEFQQPLSSLIYPSNQFIIRKPLLHLVQASALSSKITVHPDGQITFMGTAIELKDLLSVVLCTHQTGVFAHLINVSPLYYSSCSLNCRLVSRELPSKVEGETGGRGEMVEIDHGIEGEESDEGVIEEVVMEEEEEVLLEGEQLVVGGGKIDEKDEGGGRGRGRGGGGRRRVLDGAVSGEEFGREKKETVYTEDLEVPLVMSAKI
ncbi:hypothetical protein V8G54_033549 [Vigna mungo]|uniref:Uncharacterized protein n=1 Tax=Vigna mungo TaxID=3915 RepID=A0AAQ3MP73_VIGMU